MEEFLQCPICCVNYDKNVRIPRQLPCQHNLCSVCLPYMIKRNSNQNSSYIECPMCREKINRPINEIPKTLLIMQILDANPTSTANTAASSSASSASQSSSSSYASASQSRDTNNNYLSNFAVPSSNNMTSMPTAPYPVTSVPITYSVNNHPPSNYNINSNNNNQRQNQPSNHNSEWNFKNYLRKIFNDIDVNKDGSITAGELQRALRLTQASSEFDMKTIELLISKYDTDGDREISFEEFYDLFNNLNEEFETFLLTDADGSGFIDLHEFTEALKGKGFYLSNKFYENIVDEICKRTKKPGIQFDIYIRVAARFDRLCHKYNLTLYYQKNSLENYLKKHFFDDFW